MSKKNTNIIIDDNDDKNNNQNHSLNLLSTETNAASYNAAGTISLGACQ